MSLKQALLHFSARTLLTCERLFRSRPSSSDILILEYMLPLGCCVHMTPVFEAIKTTRPDARVIVATRGLGFELLRHHPYIDHLIATPDPLHKTQDAAQTLRKELARRGLRPSMILTGASDKRTRITLLAMLAAPAHRGGFTIHSELYQQPLEYGFNRSLIDNNLRLVPLVGGSCEHLEPRVFFNSSELAVARALAAEINPGGRPLVLFVTQNSGGQRTGWHTDRFVQVIHHAAEVLNCAVGFVGTAVDREPIEQIRESAGGCGVSVAGRTSVTELAALLAISDIVVSLDTGTMHVGRAVGVPMVVLGPSWQRPIEWLPLGRPNVRILRGEDRDDVPPNYHLDEIQAEDVITALDDLLVSCPPAKHARENRIAANLSQIEHLRNGD
jgi:ADP-heptose:LPS heptosyltransferase